MKKTLIFLMVKIKVCNKLKLPNNLKLKQIQNNNKKNNSFKIFSNLLKLI